MGKPAWMDEVNEATGSRKMNEAKGNFYEVERVIFSDEERKRVEKE